MPNGSRSQPRPEPHVASVPRTSTSPAQVTAPAARLAACAAALAALGHAFGLDAERLARAEDLARVEAVARLPLDRLDGVAPAEVAGWFADLGADLRVELQVVGIGLPDGDEPVVLRHDTAPGDAFATFVAAARERQEAGGDALDMEARVVLAKDGLVAAAREALSARPGFLGTAEVLAVTTVAVFFSQDACARTLLAPEALSLWQSADLAHTNGRAVLMLLDAAGYPAGPALEVIGARDLDTLPWLDLDAAAWQESVRRRTRARELRAAESIWTIPTCGLTSEALAVEQRAPGMDGIARAVDGFRERLAAMELATSVQASPADAGDADDPADTLLLRFSGEPVRACLLPAGSAAADDANAGQGAPLVGEALSRLAAFAYGSETPDRLYIARECLAHGFPAVPRVTFAELADAARRALPAAAATFNLYLKRQAEHYFTARQQALDAVTTYAEVVRQSVSDLANDVVSDVYKTAGLLVAVIIAALIGPAHARLVWVLGTVAYLAYLAFIVRFLLPARERRFALDEQAMSDRLNVFSELTQEERDKIEKDANSANDYFRHYLRRARWSRWLYSGLAAWVYYLLAAVGIIFLLVLLTPLGAHLPLVAAPAPTPTPTPAP